MKKEITKRRPFATKQEVEGWIASRGVEGCVEETQKLAKELQQEITTTPRWDNESLEFRINPDEPVYRPFKCIQELKKAWSEKHNPLVHPDIEEPIIWVKSKSSVTSTLMITHFNGSMGTVHLLSSMSVSLETLFNDYTFLDGTPCGVKED